MTVGGQIAETSASATAGLLPELLGEFVVIEALVLSAGMFDLQRTHQVADASTVVQL